MIDSDILMRDSLASHQAGDFVTAANGYAAVLGHDPRNADAWHLAGLLAYQNGKPIDAINQINMAIDLKSSDPEYFSNLSAVLNSINDPGQALVAATEAVKVNPEFAPGHYQSGVALSRLGKSDEAIESFEAALACGADAAVTLNEIANLLQFNGELQKATDVFERIIDVAPEYSHSYLQLAKFVATGQYEFTRSQINNIGRLLQEPDSLADNKDRLHIALATHHESAKDFDRAFTHFEAAASLSQQKLKLKNVQFPVKQHERTTANLIRLFDGQRVKEMAAFGNESQQPIFIVGMPRSGTTLTQQILSRHPDVGGGEELTIINEIVMQRFKNLALLNNDDLNSDRCGQWITDSAVRYLSQTENIDSALLANRNSKHIVDKMPGNFVHLGFIHMMFPNARIINCMRDPRDVCLSSYCTLFQNDRLQCATTNWWSLATIYRQYFELSRHWEKLFGDNIYSLRYENLAAQTASEIECLLNFLSLSHDKNCFSNESSRGPVRSASLAQVRRPVYTTSIGKWQKYKNHLGEIQELLSSEIAWYENQVPASLSTDQQTGRRPANQPTRPG